MDVSEQPKPRTTDGTSHPADVGACATARGGAHGAAAPPAGRAVAGDRAVPELLACEPAFAYVASLSSPYDVWTLASDSPRILGRVEWSPVCEHDPMEIQIAWTVDVIDGEALRKFVEHQAATELAPHPLAKEAARARSHDDVSALATVAGRLLTHAEIPGIMTRHVQVSPSPL